jgi:hypothetical protein
MSLVSADNALAQLETEGGWMGVPTYFPRLDFMSSQGTSAVLQFLHGFSSITLHRTRRELHALHAFFARDRGRPATVVSVELGVILFNLKVQAYVRCGWTPYEPSYPQTRAVPKALNRGVEYRTVEEALMELLIWIFGVRANAGLCVSEQPKCWRRVSSFNSRNASKFRATNGVQLLIAGYIHSGALMS